MEQFDVIVIGGGPAGREHRRALHRVRGDASRWSRRSCVGGECSYWACMPSKALLRPGEVLAEVRRVPGAAAAVTGELDVDAVLDWRDDIVAQLGRQGPGAVARGRGGVLVRGHGRLVGERRVDVELADGRCASSRRRRRSCSRPVRGGDPADRRARATSACGTAATPLGAGTCPSGSRARRWRRRRRDGAGVEAARRARGDRRSTRRRASRGATRAVRRRASCAPRSRPRASRWCSARRRCAPSARRRRRAGHAHARRRPHVHRRRAARRDRPAAQHRRHRARHRRPRTGEAGRGRRPARAPPASPAVGSTRSATATAARCSPTWASTRRASRPTSILQGSTVEAWADHRAVPASCSPIRSSRRSASPSARRASRASTCRW